MAVKYTMRTVETDKLTVDYADGSWAEIPLRRHLDASQIEDLIASFNPQSDYFESVDEVPFRAGQTGEIATFWERQQQSNQTIVNYVTARGQAYPPIGEQLDALYWARKGDTSKLELIDSRIDEVKETYPKDMPTMTRAEFDEALGL